MNQVDSSLFVFIYIGHLSSWLQARVYTQCCQIYHQRIYICHIFAVYICTDIIGVFIFANPCLLVLTKLSWALLCANFSNVKYGATNIPAYLSFIPATGAPCIYIKLGKLKVDSLSKEVNFILCF